MAKTESATQLKRLRNIDAAGSAEQGKGSKVIPTDAASKIKQNKTMTVDIVIPAFNEERCIEDILRDVSLSRPAEWFQVQNIFVISDASTDRTEETVERIAAGNPRIKLIRKPTRRGKQDSINLALAITKADVVVFIDADVRLENENTLEKLLQHFHDDSVGVVQGGLVRISPGFTLNPAKLAAYFDWLVVNKLRRQKPLSWWSVDGRVMALSRDFYRNLALPLSLADDQFIFYSCIRDGHKFVWAEDAIFYYGPPESIADFSHQWSRYFFYTRKSAEYFGKELISKDMGMPGLWRTIISCAFRHPLCGAMWLLCYSLSKIEYLLQIDFRRYEHGLFWTKSNPLDAAPQGTAGYISRK